MKWLCAGYENDLSELISIGAEITGTYTRALAAH